jgi:hypothetical protein
MTRRTFGLLLAAMIVAVPFCRSNAADDFKPEPGFKMLFNGNNLDGWKMKKGGESLDGKTEAANGRFKVVDGVLVLDPKVKGDIYIETAQEFSKDLVIRFDYKPGKTCNNDLLLRSTKFDIKTPDVKNWKENEWNEFEIVIQGTKAEFKSNGETQKTLTTKGDKSGFVLRAEIGPVEYRRLRIKEAE